MTDRLLQRQVSLLEYLTSGAAIFGERAGAAVPRPLRGIDPHLLHLEAQFSYDKRMAKITGAFPHTFAMLGDELDAILREFVDTCPPVDISRIVNARQFHDFLVARWRRFPPEPPFLPDVAACELACGSVHTTFDAPAAQGGRLDPDAPAGSIRRHPGIVLLRCAYDVRPIFEHGSDEAEPAERDTPLVVAVPLGHSGPRIAELPPVVFDLLASLDDWADPSAFADTAEAEELLLDLIDHGLVEVRA
jgi:hypothetical protein